MILIESQAVGPFFKNGFVVACEATREALLIDPGDEVAGLLAFAGRQQLAIRYILLTHAHVDHVTGVAAAKRVWDVPVFTGCAGTAVRCAGSAAGGVASAAVHEPRVTVGSSARAVVAGMRRSGALG